MKCKNPYQLNRQHKKKIYGGPSGSHYTFQVPCGKCLWCRLQRQKEWFIRLTHENDGHETSCFTTLTYDQHNVPKTLSNDKHQIETLKPDDLKNFWKRLRIDISGRGLKGWPGILPGTGKKIKYFACGEYGEDGDRPHYHAIIFNLDPSTNLEQIWGLGFTRTDVVTPNRLAYVAKYISKKQYGKNTKEHYNGREPEFARQSLGLGEKYVDTNPQLLWDGHIKYKGQELRIPRYYEKKAYKKLSPERKELYDFRKRISSRLSQSEESLRILGYGGRPYTEHTAEEKALIRESQIRDAGQMDLNLRSKAGLEKQKRMTNKL